MESIFDLEIQQNSTDAKIVAGLERISQVFKVLLWEKAAQFGLSPIQIQLLIFIRYHSKEKATVSYLAKEFNVTKATISETVKVLEKKNYIVKNSNTRDSRSYAIGLTDEGLKIVSSTENFTYPLTDSISTISQKEKIILWKNISSLLYELHLSQVIKVESSCYSCRFYTEKNKEKHCSLMDLKLETQNIRLDCREHEPLLL